MTVDSLDALSGRGTRHRSNSLPHIKVTRGTSAGQLSLENVLTSMCNSPTSPKTPLSCLVRESFLRNPVAPQHHTLHLNEFSEMDHDKDRCGTRTPTPPSLQRRCYSKSSVSGDDSKHGSRMPSKEVAQSSSRKPSKESPVSREEMNRKIREEVDWFHAARAINKSIRTSEETEAMLAAARLRRAQGDSVSEARRSRAASKQSATSAKDEAEEQEEVQPPIRRKGTDLVALWGAKPVTKAQEPQPTIARSTSSAMRAGAQCGQAESLRSRLKRRTTVE